MHTHVILAVARGYQAPTRGRDSSSGACRRERAPRAPCPVSLSGVIFLGSKINPNPCLTLVFTGFFAVDANFVVTKFVIAQRNISFYNVFGRQCQLCRDNMRNVDFCMTKCIVAKSNISFYNVLGRQCQFCRGEMRACKRKLQFLQCL